MSGTSDSGLRDAVTAELNPSGPEPDYGPQPEPVADRPANGASKDVWIDYVVALGADRTFVTSDTYHFDGTGYAPEPGLSRADLIALADRLGG